MKRYVFATHHSMASGLKDTMEFLTKSDDPIYDVSAYMNEAGDEDLAAVVAELFSQFDSTDTVVVMTDLMSGSVNQKFFPYMNEHVFLLSGVNVPLAMQLLLTDEEELTADYIEECVQEARSQLLLLNTRQADEGDEDE
ncbi:MAG: PTS sorbitol transporter subunit IIB [Lachnospiraceae bacterium]|nr:PTS sorbitol transporter subunit IIB [Lachnospiraceae bacterium]